MATVTKSNIATVTVPTAVALVAMVLRWQQADSAAWAPGYNATIDRVAHGLWADVVALAATCSAPEVARVRRMVAGTIADAIDEAMRAAK